MATLAETIRADAISVLRLTEIVKATSPYKSIASKNFDTWADANIACLRAVGRLNNPGNYPSWRSLFDNADNPTEVALAFLEVDPYFSGSGYIKQLLWRFLKQADLDQQATKNAEALVLDYLNRRMSRDFWEMVRFVRRHGTNRLWNTLQLLSKRNDLPGIKAGWILASRENLPVRKWVYGELRKVAHADTPYVPNFKFYASEGHCTV